jgi:hypothetical protein
MKKIYKLFIAVILLFLALYLINKVTYRNFNFKNIRENDKPLDTTMIDNEKYTLSLPLSSKFCLAWC